MASVIGGEASTDNLKLALQFGLVSLTLLLVPWAGCAFLAENERALQQAQTEATAAVAQTVAAALSNQPRLMYPSPERRAAPLAAQGLSVSRMDPAPLVDGWLETDEWQQSDFRTYGSSRRSLRVGMARSTKQLYIGAVIREPVPTYRSPQREDLLHSDRLELRLGLTPSARYVIAPEGPGLGQIMRVTGDLLVPVADTVVGWQETGAGYEIEITLPTELAAGRLGFSYVGVDDSGEDPVSTTPEGIYLPWLVAADADLDRWLAAVAPEGMQVEVYDRWQWPLATAGEATVQAPTSGFWLLRRLYRWILPPQSLDPPYRRDELGRLQPSLLGTSNENRRVQVVGEDGDTLIVTAPIRASDEILGVVAVSRPLEEFLSLTDQAFARLLGRGLLILLFTGAALLGFAGLTSWRIRRLGQQLQTAGVPTPRGHQLSVSPLGDEIDELAEQVNQQLAELDDYQRYLTSLNQTLAHELRTPVAIIASSLDNLSLDNVDAERRDALMQRARSGVDRLQALFAALQEARRLEQALDTETREPTDLSRLLVELTDAYGQTFTQHQFRCEVPGGTCTASVAPEQIVQAIDKLVDNAVSYAPAQSVIALALEHRGLWWRIAVTNQGSTLPDASERSLFEPLVSHRSESGSEFHMGLGLHIVRLIAQHHGGEPFAHNLDDQSGVRIGFSIQG